MEQKKQVSVHLGMAGGTSPDMPRTPYQGDKGKHSQRPTMYYHATPPAPSCHHLYIIHLIKLLHCLYRITMLQCHLNDHN